MKKNKSIFVLALIFVMLCAPIQNVSAKETTDSSGTIAQTTISNYKNIATVEYGKAYSIQGTIYSPQAFTKVKVNIYNDIGKLETGATHTLSNKSQTFNLKTIDPKVYFNKLYFGEKTLKVIITINGVDKVIKTDKFTVKANDVKVTTSGLSVPKSVKGLNNFKPKGIIKSNYEFDYLGYDLYEKGQHVVGSASGLAFGKTIDLSKQKFEFSETGSYEIRLYVETGGIKKVIYTGNITITK
ncbi:hypothetical protein [Clostridium sp. LP20]|uniref:hypothetical protein n=1 Tax=Clostridium sp. LP20 TaxID=3418665 RepID=UPI003EE54F7F